MKALQMKCLQEFRSVALCNVIRHMLQNVRSLALKSRKPFNSPNAHTNEELNLIRKMYKRNGIYGLAEVYMRC